MTPATLKLIRLDKAESVSRFSIRLGISRNTLGAYEKGLKPIPLYIELAAMAIEARLGEMK